MSSRDKSTRWITVRCAPKHIEALSISHDDALLAFATMDTIVVSECARPNVAVASVPHEVYEDAVLSNALDSMCFTCTLATGIFLAIL